MSVVPESNPPLQVHGDLHWLCYARRAGADVVWKKMSRPSPSVPAPPPVPSRLSAMYPGSIFNENGHRNKKLHHRRTSVRRLSDRSVMDGCTSKDSKISHHERLSFELVQGQPFFYLNSARTIQVLSQIKRILDETME